MCLNVVRGMIVFVVVFECRISVCCCRLKFIIMV